MIFIGKILFKMICEKIHEINNISSYEHMLKLDFKCLNLLYNFFNK